MPPNTGRPPERALLIPVLRAALRAGWAHQMALASVEIPWHQKRVDLGFVGVDGLVTVELKVANWRKAIAQASVNRWAADLSWVAIWHEHASESAFNAAGSAGVGLIVVTADTAYPWLRPIPRQPSRSKSSPLMTSITDRGTRIRDLLSAAKEPSRAAFA